MVASAHFQAEIFLVSAWPYRRFDSARHSCLFVTAGVACMVCIYIYIYRVHYIYHIYMLRAGVGCMIYIYLIIIITIISEMTDIYLLFLIFQIVLVKIVFIISTADYIVSHFLSSSVQWAKQKKIDWKRLPLLLNPPLFLQDTASAMHCCCCSMTTKIYFLRCTYI